MPLEFTVEYDDLTNDLTDVSGSVAAVAAIGEVIFETSVLPGHRIPALSNLPRKAGLAVRTFSGFLDNDGRLKTAPGGDLGVRLWANDPDYGITRMQYRVRATLTDYLGNPVPWEPFYFDAPREDLTVNLAAEIPKPQQKFGRGRPGFGLARNGVDVDAGDLILVREDGYELARVEVPELSETLNEAAAESISYIMTFGR